MKDAEYGYNAILDVAVLEEVHILDNKPIAYVIRGVGKGFNCLKGYTGEGNLGELVHVNDGETVVLGRMDMCMFLLLSGSDGRIKTASGKVVFLIPKRDGILVGVSIESCDYAIRVENREVSDYIKSQEAAAALVSARETGMLTTSIL